MFAFYIDLIYMAVYRNAFIMQIWYNMFTHCINFKDYKSATIIVSFYCCDGLELKYRQYTYVT